MTEAISPHLSGQIATQSERDKKLMQAAQSLEASFLAEMLKSAGLGETSKAFGGVGEDQFASFLVEAQAHEMAEAGGIGLAETLFNAMKERDLND